MKCQTQSKDSREAACGDQRTPALSIPYCVHAVGTLHPPGQQQRQTSPDGKQNRVTQLVSIPSPPMTPHTHLARNPVTTYIEVLGNQACKHSH